MPHHTQGPKQGATVETTLCQYAGPNHNKLHERHPPAFSACVKAGTATIPRRVANTVQHNGCSNVLYHAQRRSLQRIQTKTVRMAPLPLTETRHVHSRGEGSRSLYPTPKHTIRLSSSLTQWGVSTRQAILPGYAAGRNRCQVSKGPSPQLSETLASDTGSPVRH